MIIRVLNIWLCLNLKHTTNKHLYLPLLSPFKPIMKWTNPEFVEILSRALNRFEEADGDGRQVIVDEIRKQIRECGKKHNLEVPKDLGKVHLISEGSRPMLTHFP
jgi:hypothetical protein